MIDAAEKTVAQIEPVLAGIEQAAAMLAISATAFKALERTGQIGPMPVHLGNCKRRLYCIAEIRRWATEGRCCSREKWQAMKDEENF